MEAAMKLWRLFLSLLLMAALQIPLAAAGQNLLSSPEMEKTFQFLDKNQDGKLSKEEYGAIWKNPQIAERNFQALDTNKDGVISREEFLNPPVKRK
jgi:Ca2+-binding EF-hand superfamily protein